MKQSIIIYDLETTSVDVKTAIPRIMGFKSSKCDGFQYTTDINEMVQLLNEHDVIVGYNSIEYDNEIMKKFGATPFYKVNIDCMQIIHGKGFGNDLGRKGIITVGGEHLASKLHGKSLAETSLALGGPAKIGDFDYNLFKKEFHELSEEDRILALQYLRADIDATEFIYKYLEDYFTDFRDGGIELNGKFVQFMNDTQRRKKQYLTASTAAFTYKALCNLAGLEEKYGNSEPEDYGGGFVALPSQESCSGNIYCLDFASLYPHIMMQANLYGRVDVGWKGTDFSETTGTYNNEYLAPVGFVLQQLYQKRREYKKQKDAKEYTIKIIINTIYGLLGNPSFASVCDFVAAADCTRLGRQWIQYARKQFYNAGYNVLYTDTDSVYLEDPFSDENRLLKVKNEIIADIKKSVPFPQDTFDMAIDAKIEFIGFVKAADGSFLKKNYFYVTTDKKLKVKGMQIVKSNCTPLSKKIFEDYIKPQIINSHKCKFTKSTIESWIESELKKDIKLAAVFYKIKNTEDYKLDSQVQSQISKHKLYGPGQHYLLKLKGPHEKGCGKNANYLGVQYVSEIKLSSLDLTKSWAELDPFIEDTQSGLKAFF